MNIKKARIEFISGFTETILPIVKLTKSKTGITGTATFIFINPLIFKSELYSFNSINGMFLIWDNKKIMTKDLKIVFKSGKPFLLKAIFIFKNSIEWFNFLNFMTFYSKETGLLFSEGN